MDIEPSTDTVDRSLFGFYGHMTVTERRTFWSCAAGWTMDGMDFMIYPLVIGTIIRFWKIDYGTAGAAVTATLLCSAAGGWLAGYISDRIGRVLTLKITILWFSLFSLISAISQNFGQLIIARALLGLGFGGEWAVGSVLMGELVRARCRGRAVGAVQSGYAVGWGIAVLSQAVFFSILPDAQAWRWMFAMGGLPALLVFTLLRYAKEPPLAAAARMNNAQGGRRPAIWEIFKPPYLRSTVLAALMLTGAQGGYYAMSTWLPQFLTTGRHLSIVGSTEYLATLIVGAFIGFLAGAWLADIIGRRRTFMIFSVGAIVVILMYLQLSLQGSAIWLLGFPLGFFSCGYFSGLGPFLTEIFPTRLRGSGQGFCYNFGRGLGALFPAFVGKLAGYTTLGNAITILSVAAYIIFFLTSLVFPETAGKELD